MGRILAHTDPQGRIQRFLNDPAGDRLTTRVAASQAGNEADWQRSGEHEGTRYRFNRAGNLTHRQDADSLLELDWDANQRLIASHRGGTDGQRLTTRYAYDPLGRRLWKETVGVRTTFGWDGDALALDAIRGTAREFVYRPNTFEPLALLRGPTASALHYLNDPNGCPVRLIDPTGQVMWTARYTGWGGIAHTREEGRGDNPIRLQGQYADQETGLHYNRYRYFDAGIGGFVSQDPLGLEPGENQYTFALNSLAWIDPLGLSCGRAGKQARLRELLNDIKISSAIRGWIQQEINAIKRGARRNIRNPPGKDLAHMRGREAKKGYGYKYSNLQDRDLHKLQHKYDDFGRANKHRPLP